MTSLRSTWRVVLLPVLLAAASLVGSCGRDASAPVANGVTLVRRGAFSVEPLFPRLVTGKSLEGVVAFEKVRIVLHRADGSVALDTTVLFPVGADSVVLAATVPLSPTAGSGGENFKLDLGYMNAVGEVVFKGGPVDVTVAPKGSNTNPPPVQIPVRYSGPGSTATKVTIAPRSVSVVDNQGFTFTAVASDASGTALPSTPLVWASLDPSRALINQPSLGVGNALGIRGTARIVAQLLTGPADTVLVTISLSPKAIALQGGDGQKGIVSTALPQPVAVKVTASDGVGVGGVNVAFAVVTGGGSVANATVATDASGVASTGWTLGATPGEQTITASVSGLTGSPVTFKATARSVTPVALSIVTEPPASNGAGNALPLTVKALDAQGDIAKSFTGTVTVALSASSPSVPLLGTLTATAVDGVASFSDLRINQVGTGYALTTSASGLRSATTSSFAIVPGPAQRLEFGSYPVFGMPAGVLDAVAVIARDRAGNVATGFTGAVTVSLLASPSGAVLTGTTKLNAVAGVATFENLLLTLAGEYQLLATSPDIVAGKGPAFPVTPGPANQLFVVSGSGQTGSPGGSLGTPVTFGLRDRYGNTTYTTGLTVTFAASDGGSASPSSGVTTATGQLSTTWTLGRITGTQTLTASSAGLGAATASATASGVASPSGGGEILVVDDVNAFDDNYGFAKSGATYNYGNAKLITNFLNYSTSGAHAGASKVLLVADRGNSDYTLAGSNWYNFGSLLTNLGLTWTQTSSHSAVAPVASNVKLVIIHTPMTNFSFTEINGLKAFAADGGRILMVGENQYYYSYQSVETALLRNLGSSITVVPACAAWGEIVRSVSHPLTAGVSLTGTGGFYQICSSYHTGHGANDTILMYDAANRVVGTVIQVNTTPLQPALLAPMRAQRSVQAEVAVPRKLTGSPDLTIGPAKRP